MGQNLTVPAEFNQSRQVFSFPSWFITNHDVTPADVRNARSFISSYYLDQTATYELIKGNLEENKRELFLYFYHRIGINCPELVRINNELDELSSISFRDYDEKGCIIGESIFILVIQTLLATLSQVSTRIQLHSQSCRLVVYLNSNNITSKIYLELIDVVFSAVILFTSIQPTHPGVESVLKVFSSLYEVYFELNLIASEDCNHTLGDVIYIHNQPYLDWMPAVFSVGYPFTDQLVLWLLSIINISFLNHVLHGNQLQFNLTDIVMITVDYARIGLQRENQLFLSNELYKHRDKHLRQHEEFAQKVLALKSQISFVSPVVILKRLSNILNEWLSVHVLITDKYMIEMCVPSELRKKPDSKRLTTATESQLFDQPNCLSYLKKYQIAENTCCPLPQKSFVFYKQVNNYPIRIPSFSRAVAKPERNSSLSF